jgi:hypothetical protein
MGRERVRELLGERVARYPAAIGKAAGRGRVGGNTSP